VTTTCKACGSFLLSGFGDLQCDINIPRSPSSGSDGNLTLSLAFPKAPRIQDCSDANVLCCTSTLNSEFWTPELNSCTVHIVLYNMPNASVEQGPTQPRFRHTGSPNRYISFAWVSRRADQAAIAITEPVILSCRGLLQSTYRPV